MHETGFWPTWYMGGMWIFPIIGISVMLICVYLIFGRRGGGPCWGNNSPNDSETPLEILKKRYAKGEISKEQFEEMKRNLS